ncbi:MAG TPA: glycoside hydrolase family 15 protein [Thermomicrobiaceae bacterium]|nr:glycoside hydrolase family 15 protein [Thermomicrobiaceae bacterium]
MTAPTSVPDQLQALAGARPAASQPLIGDYGLIGDARSGALISRAGSLDWWCLPRFDGDPVFARLLDSEIGGFCAIEPVGLTPSRRAYRGPTNILVSEFAGDGAVVQLVDFMPALTEAQKRRFTIPSRAVVRRVVALSGQSQVRLTLKVRPNAGRTIPRIRVLGPGSYQLAWDSHALQVTSSVPLEVSPERALTALVTLRAGERLDLVLAHSAEAPAPLLRPASLDLIERLTEDFWRGWAARCRYDGPYREAVLRSALVLKALTFAPSGAVIAAPTTSLPEVIGGERNWDYRYCWLRDAAFTIRALLRLGYQKEARAFAAWLLYATRLTHPELQVMYTVFGNAHIPERVLAYLRGYRASWPVRIGNEAANQFQLDIYGEVLDALALYHRAGGAFDRDARGMLDGLVQVILRRWREPDDGIWEPRSGPAQHVHSKLMAAVGLDRALELAHGGALRLPAHVVRERDAIRDWLLREGFDARRQSFTSVPGGNLDAALLVIPLLDFLPPSDPRVIGTVEAVQRELADGALVYRYDAPDGLSGREGAFVLCSFWLVEALAKIGRLDEAHAHFRRLLAYRNDLGLLAEELDPATGEQLGNFPQAFSHIGLINAALTLEDMDQRCASGE